MIHKLSIGQRLLLAVAGSVVIGACAVLIWSQQTHDRLPQSRVSAATPSHGYATTDAAVRSSQEGSRAVDVASPFAAKNIPPITAGSQDKPTPEPPEQELHEIEAHDAAQDTDDADQESVDVPWFHDPDPRVVAELLGHKESGVIDWGDSEAPSAENESQAAPGVHTDQIQPAEVDEENLVGAAYGHDVDAIEPDENNWHVEPSGEFADQIRQTDITQQALRSGQSLLERDGVDLPDEVAQDSHPPVD